MKFMIMILFAVTLNILCERNLTTIAWIIVFLPFVFMSVITIMLVTSDKIVTTNVEGMTEGEKKNYMTLK